MMSLNIKWISRDVTWINRQHFVVGISGEGILFRKGRICRGTKDGKKRGLHQTKSSAEEKKWDDDWEASRMKDNVEKCFLSLQRIAVKYDKWWKILGRCCMLAILPPLLITICRWLEKKQNNYRWTQEVTFYDHFIYTNFKIRVSIYVYNLRFALLSCTGMLLLIFLYPECELRGKDVKKRKENISLRLV